MKKTNNQNNLTAQGLAEGIQSKLGGKINTSKGNYTCRCPAHDDQNESLSIKDGLKGVVLYCHAGCDTEKDIFPRLNDMGLVVELSQTPKVTDINKAKAKNTFSYARHFREDIKQVKHVPECMDYLKSRGLDSVPFSNDVKGDADHYYDQNERVEGQRNYRKVRYTAPCIFAMKRDAMGKDGVLELIFSPISGQWKHGSELDDDKAHHEVRKLDKSAKGTSCTVVNGADDVFVVGEGLESVASVWVLSQKESSLSAYKSATYQFIGSGTGFNSYSLPEKVKKVLFVLDKDDSGEEALSLFLMNHPNIDIHVIKSDTSGDLNDVLVSNSGFTIERAAGRTLLSEAEAIEAINKDTFFISGSSMKPFRVTLNPITGGTICNEVDMSGLKMFWKNKKVPYEVPTKDGGTQIKYKNPLDVWIESIERREYDGIFFDPSCGKATPTGSYFNAFTGWSVKPVDTGADTSAIHYHLLEVISDNDKEKYDYLLNYIAHMFQKPEELPEVGLVMKSEEQGTGKSAVTVLLEALMGSEYTVTFSSQDRMTGQFNSLLENKILVVGEEALYSKSQKGADILKQMMTGLNIAIEKKGQDPVFQRNYSRFIMISNNEQAVKVDIGERRFVTYDVSAKHVQDHVYFCKLFESIGDEKVLSQFMHELMNRDIRGFSARARPKNLGGRDQFIESLPPAYLWIHSILDKGLMDIRSIYLRTEGGTRDDMPESIVKTEKQYPAGMNISYTMLRSHFSEWKRDKSHMEVSDASMGRVLGQVFKKGPRRTSVYNMLTLNEARKNFEKLVKRDDLQLWDEDWLDSEDFKRAFFHANLTEMDEFNLHVFLESLESDELRTYQIKELGAYYKTHGHHAFQAHLKGFLDELEQDD